MQRQYCIVRDLFVALASERLQMRRRVSESLIALESLESLRPQTAEKPFRTVKLESSDKAKFVDSLPFAPTTVTYHLSFIGISASTRLGVRRVRRRIPMRSS